MSLHHFKNCNVLIINHFRNYGVEDELGAIPAPIAPREKDIVITKHRVSAFAGTDLAMILRAKDIEMLVLYGIATSGVVLSTLLEASDADYRLAVLGDCCADLDAPLHDCLIQRFFPTRGSVISAQDFIATPLKEQ